MVEKTPNDGNDDRSKIVIMKKKTLEKKSKNKMSQAHNRCARVIRLVVPVVYNRRRMIETIAIARNAPLSVG